MSLQVKFPYGRGHGPLHTCGDCSFATRHRILFERHQKRCPTKRAADAAQGKLPAPPVCRNYRCEKCSYTSNKARVFLFHKKRIHGENITVYVCNKCEYASKHKNKVFRHRRLVHKDQLPIDDIGTIEDEADLGDSGFEPVVIQEQDTSAHYDGEHFDYNGTGCVEEGVDMDQAVYGEDDQFNLMEDDDEVSFKIPTGDNSENTGANNADEHDPENTENIPGGSGIIDPNEKAMDYIVWTERGPGKTTIGSCRVCGYTNAHRWKIAHHVRSTHMKKNLFQCPHCDFSCQRKIEWCIHKTSHAKHKVHSCAECSYQTTMKRNMERHTARHRHHGPYKCSFCSYSSTGDAVIQRHMAEYHAESFGPNATAVPARVIQQPLEPAVKRIQRARKTGPTVSSSALVFNTSHPYAAPAVAHSTPKGSPASSTGSPEVTCDLCSLVVKTESRLRIHMVSHSNLAAWTCPLCPLRYKRPADLNRHMKRKHGLKLSEYKRGSTPEQDQPLDLCVKREEQSETEDELREDSPLDLTMGQQDSVALFKQDVVKCSFCSYKTQTASDLRRHMLVHSVEKRFRCQYCGHRYKFQADLTEHLRKYHRVSTSHVRAVGGSVGSLVPATTEYSANSGEVEIMPMVTEPPEIKQEEDSDSNSNSPAKKEEDLQCRYCPYVGKYRTETERHMRLHTGEKPYQCMYCLYRTIWKGDMKRHLPKHHADEVVKHADLQDLVDQTWNPWPESLRLTEDRLDDENLDDFPDPMASLAALVDGGLENAESDQALPEENNNESPQKGKMESCYLGGSWEVSDSAATTESTDDKRDAGLAGNNNREACALCGHVTYPAAMKQHMEKHSNLRRFMCPDCGRRSNWPWDIKKHIKDVHHGDVKSLVELSEQEARDTLEDYMATNTHRTYRSSSVPRDTPEKETKPASAVDMVDHIPPYPVFNKQRSPSPEKGKSDRYRKYKCSECGKRSNWRWDLNKHIRTSHPEAQVIELSDEEAKATFHEVLLRQKSPSPVRKLKEPSPAPGHVEESQHHTLKCYKCSKCSYRCKVEGGLEGHIMTGTACEGAEVVKLSNEEARRLDKVEHAKRKKFGPVTKVKELSLADNVDLLKLRRFKCSHCPYRSNFKASVMSHKKNKHPGARARLVVLTLKYARACEEDRLSQLKVKGTVGTSDGTSNAKTEGEVSVKSASREGSPSKEAGTEGVRCSPWKCSECDFNDVAKTMVLEHLRKDHPNVAVFTCKICGYSTGYRNSCYRHIRGKHGKVNVMPFVQEPGISRSTPDRVLGDAKREEEEVMEVENESKSPVAVTKTYHCSICGIDSTAKPAIVDHVREAHPQEANPEAVVEELAKIQPAQLESYEIVPQKRHRSPGVIKRGIIQCNICPYSTNKQGLLKIHKKNHKQHPDKPYKCKYCPYYLSASRLMKQHHRLHWQVLGIKEQTLLPARTPIRMTLKKKSPLVADVPLDLSPQKSDNGARSPKKTRYLCDKCPLVGHHIKRFMYHKQLHRPRPNNLKCPHCPYWTVSKHCLVRHERCHTEAYIRQHRPDLLTTPVKKMAGMAPGMSTLPTVEASPCKSEISEMSTDDVVEMASIKQQVIASKIASVPITPCKLNQRSSNGLPASAFMPGVVLGSQGQIVSSGPVRKLHKCPHCPYTNVRYASLQMHERMHLERASGSSKELFKCMYCTYQVGNKGLLSLHLKVHSQQYTPGLEEINDVEAMGAEEETGGKEKPEEEAPQEGIETKPEEATEDTEDRPKPPKIAKFPDKQTYPRDMSTHYDMNKLPLKTEYYVKVNEHTGEHVLERAVYKKWCCEKCPYATMKKSQFEKHALLHGSAQKYTCEFCDYSVPGYHLLLQHKRLHLSPNPNLLSVQSIANLQRLPTIPADVAAAGNLCEEVGAREERAGGSHDNPRPLTHHEHVDLYENSADFYEPKKLYRCDRCPYTNTRRDHLLSHLKFHMMKSDVKCPFCDYSVSKVHLLNQHIKVHFNTPGSEMNAEGPSGSSEDKEPEMPKLVRETDSPRQSEVIDISQLAQELATASKDSAAQKETPKGGNSTAREETDTKAVTTEEGREDNSEAAEHEQMEVDDSSKVQGQDHQKTTPDEPAALDLSLKGPAVSKLATTASYEECCYCNREFMDLAKLQRHEAQHMAGMPFTKI